MKKFRDRAESAAGAVAVTPLPADYNGMAEVHANDPLVGPHAGQGQGMGTGSVPIGGSSNGDSSGNNWLELYLLGLHGNPTK